MSWFSGIRKSARPIHFVNLALGLGLVVVGYFVIRTWGLGQDHTPVSRPEGDPNTRRPAAEKRGSPGAPPHAGEPSSAISVERSARRFERRKEVGGRPFLDG